MSRVEKGGQFKRRVVAGAWQTMGNSPSDIRCIAFGGTSVSTEPSAAAMTALRKPAASAGKSSRCTGRNCLFGVETSSILQVYPNPVGVHFLLLVYEIPHAWLA